MEKIKWSNDQIAQYGVVVVWLLIVSVALSGVVAPLVLPKQTYEYLVEQTALTRLILGYEESNRARVGNKFNLTIGGSKIVTELLNCEMHNYNWIEEGVDPEKNKIVHFKGGRHSGQRFIELVGALGLEKELADVMRRHQT